MCPAQDFDRLGDPFHPFFGRRVHLAWRDTPETQSAHPVSSAHAAPSAAT
jgi:hypothetical protein